MAEEEIREQAALFAALADPTRLKLLMILCHQSQPGCQCVINLSEHMGITQPAVSQHLRVLKSVGLIMGERRGYRVHYQVDPEGMRRCHVVLSAILQFHAEFATDSPKRRRHFRGEWEA